MSHLGNTQNLTMSYRRACCSKENIRPISMTNSFHATSYKRPPSSPITSNPPCTKKIFLSSNKTSKCTPSRIPKAYNNIKRALSTPAICQKNVSTSRVELKAVKLISKKYPCLNCKCCESIKQMQPILLEIYQRQKNVSKLLSNANIGSKLITSKHRMNKIGYVKNDVKRRQI
uniref:CSON015606 protein n=1 Tax=Culicoides sonorensis TaxID=179676 RepID=A0A336LU71_CULSO